MSKFKYRKHSSIKPGVPMQDQVVETVTDVVEDDVIVDAVVEETQPDPVVIEPVVEEQPSVLTKPELLTATEIRLAIVQDKLKEFKDLYPTNAPMQDRDRVAMVRSIEVLINVMLGAETYTELARQFSTLAAEFHTNEGGVFAKSRILGQMREPRTGALRVQAERTVNIVTLLYLADPTTFQAQRGRVDISHLLVGCTETSAAFLLQYFG